MTEEQEGVIEEPVAAAPVNDKEKNFEALRNQLEQTRRQNEFLQMQLAERQQTSPQEDVDLHRFRDDDIPTYGELKKILSKQEQERQRERQMLKDLEMKATYSDYMDTVKTYLPDVLNEDPDLALAIKDSPQMNKLAYRLAQASPRYHQEKLAKQNATAVNKMVENANRPQPATGRKNMAVQSEDAQLEAMTDTDIMRMFNMAKARY